MKSGKASGTSGVSVEMIVASGEIYDPDEGDM